MLEDYVYAVSTRFVCTLDYVYALGTRYVCTPDLHVCTPITLGTVNDQTS